MTAKTLLKDILVTTSGVTAFTLLALAPVLAYAAPSHAANAEIITVSAPAYAGESFIQRKIQY